MVEVEYRRIIHVPRHVDHPIKIVALALDDLQLSVVVPDLDIKTTWPARNTRDGHQRKPGTVSVQFGSVTTVITGHAQSITQFDHYM